MGQEIRHDKTTVTTHVERGERGRAGFREHEGFRGRHWDKDRPRFSGFHNRFRRGAFYGEVVILDDGCWYWNGFEWVVYVDCE